ncbi:MAG TPA: ribosome maturation factor, partial [Saprospiraceae bacterium]|nr:ribosome maturation factor [Saprospiraceae bacterium]
ESHLDSHAWLGDSYLLEVSSPGVSRPLKFPRQYKRNIGRMLAVTTTDKASHLGTLQSADDERIVLVDTVKEKVDKKKVERTVETPIAYADIEKAVVKLAF